MPYIVFDCKDGRQNAINVQFYSKKQIIIIIDEIKKRAKLMGNELHIKSGSEILLDFLKSQKKKRS